MPAQADIGEGAYGEGDRQLWVVSNWRVLVDRHEATSVVTISGPAVAAATAILLVGGAGLAVDILLFTLMLVGGLPRSWRASRPSLPQRP
jgi:hypothetical protein